MLNEGMTPEQIELFYVAIEQESLNIINDMVLALGSVIQIPDKDFVNKVKMSKTEKGSVVKTYLLERELERINA